MRTVTERLVARMTTTAECHLVGVGDLAAVDVGQMFRTGDEIRTMLARGDVDVGHEDPRVRGTRPNETAPRELDGFVRPVRHDALAGEQLGHPADCDASCHELRARFAAEPPLPRW